MKPQYSEVTGQQVLPDHFRCIDGLRGVAALAVVIFHYHHFYLANAADRPSVPPSDTFPWSDVFGFFYAHGASAVQLFWVISGFVFAHVYLNRTTTLRDFAVARFARLYPLHFITLAIVAGLQFASMSWVGHWQVYSNNDLRHFSLQLLMSSDFSTLSRGLSFNGPIWSVSLEMVAYGLFFIALPMLRRFGLVAAVALTAVMLLIALDQGLDIPVIRRGAFICASYFFLGNCLYLIFQRSGPKQGTTVAVIAMSLVLWGLGYSNKAEYLMQVSASVVIVCMVALIDLKWKWAPLGWLKRLGDMSYSIYLVHVPLQMLVLIIADGMFAGTRSFATWPLTLPLFLLVTIGVADITYRRWEIPASRFLRRKLNPDNT